MKKGKIFYVIGFLVVVIFTTAIVWYSYGYNKYDGLLQVVAVDVGQGSAMYVRTPNNIELIADTGPSAQLLRSLSCCRGPFDRVLDYLIISHLDNDHMALAPRLLDEFNIAEFVSTNDTANNGLYAEVIRALGQNDTQIRLPFAGERHVLDDQVHIQYLWPQRGKTLSSNRNDTSVVFRLIYGNSSFLFTGDISKSTELELVKLYADQLRSDVLFIAHHGSKSSSDVRFLETVNPKYAVIQSGKENRYGHPHPDTIKAINSLGIPILRNDQLGNVLFISDGQTILVQ